MAATTVVGMLLDCNSGVISTHMIPHGKTVVLIILVAAIAGAIVWLSAAPWARVPGFFIPQHKAKSVDNTQFATYKNPVYGYSFAYPSEYSLADSQTYQNIFHRPGDNDTSDITVTVAQDDQFDNYGSTAQSFVVASAGITRESSGNLSAMCDADGPGATIYCDKILKQRKFVTPHGLTCYELYLEQVEDTVQTQDQPESHTVLGSVGPLYTCDITTQTNRKARALLISPTKVRQDTVTNFINSIQFR